jgi:hypothetical protein
MNSSCYDLENALYFVLHQNHLCFLFKFPGLNLRAQFKIEGKMGREGKRKRERAVWREIIGMEGKS